ncbi:MAG: PorV/PorQ family protein [Fidelibacterota bacterium]
MIRQTREITSLLVAVLLVTSLVDVAEAGSKRRRGTAGVQELLIPLGARGIAMSGSFVAGLSGIEASAWNPAGVAAMSTNGEAMFSHVNWIADINLTYVGVASRFGSNFFGVTMQTVNFGDIPITTTRFPDGTGEDFSPSYLTLGFLFSKKMTDRILFGADIKLVHEGIMRENANGLVVDAGVQYRAGTSGIRIGAALRNLGLSMIFNGPDLEDLFVPFGAEPGTPVEPRRVKLQEFEPPTNLELGVAYGPVNLGPGTVSVAGSFLNNNFSFDEFRLGGEFAFLDMLFIRGGVTLGLDPEPFGPDFRANTGDEEGDDRWERNSEEFIWGPTAGFGLNTSKFTGVNLDVDYAYRSAKFFDSVQWITISLGF